MRKSILFATATALLITTTSGAALANDLNVTPLPTNGAIDVGTLPPTTPPFPVKTPLMWTIKDTNAVQPGEQRSLEATTTFTLTETTDITFTIAQWAADHTAGSLPVVYLLIDKATGMNITKSFITQNEMTTKTMDTMTLIPPGTYYIQVWNQSDKPVSGTGSFTP